MLLLANPNLSFLPQHPRLRDSLAEESRVSSLSTRKRPKEELERLDGTETYLGSADHEGENYLG